MCIQKHERSDLSDSATPPCAVTGRMTHINVHASQKGCEGSTTDMQLPQSLCKTGATKVAFKKLEHAAFVKPTILCTCPRVQ